ncbi:MAG: hypothetical protein HGA60_09170 [Chlorobiaceae bacterium]|nr:hypothetical protein [Chlorobiaceae bacterium]
MKDRYSMVLVTGISVLHWIVFTILSGYTMGVGAVTGSSSAWLETVTWVLGSPLIYLLKSDMSVFMVNGIRWWGDDSNLQLAMSVLNSAIWGTGIGGIIQARR